MTTDDLEVELVRLRGVVGKLTADNHEWRVENGQLRTDNTLLLLANQKTIDEIRAVNERITRLLIQVRGT